MPGDPYDLYSELLKPIEGEQIKSWFPFSKWKNIYLSNRKLGDEFRYVFDRKYLQRFIGNTLERPRLLLRRTFVKATSFN